MKVGIEEAKGKYRLRLPRSVGQGSSRYISTRLDVNATNYRQVLLKALEIESNIERGLFDVTLERHKIAPEQTIVKQIQVSSNPVSPPPKPVPSVLELWSAYLEFMKPQLGPTTFKKEYLIRYTGHIKDLPTHHI